MSRSTSLHATPDMPLDQQDSIPCSPEALGAFAQDIAGLLRRAAAGELEPHQAHQAEAVLDSFGSLYRDMRELAQSLRETLAAVER